jgi:hypothetical protein
MKKVVMTLPIVAALCGAAAAPAWPLDWALPVVTVRYEVAGGATEDPEDDTLESSSLRNTVSLRIKEESDPATLVLALYLSGKDYYLQAGDYSYVKLEHDASFRLGDPWKLGYALGAKWMTCPELDSEGRSKDAVWLSAGATAAVKLTPGVGLDAGLTGRFALTDDAADARQAYAASAALSTRLGEWLLGIRYRGEARLPLGSASLAAPDLYQTASVSMQWDPN